MAPVSRQTLVVRVRQRSSIRRQTPARSSSMPSPSLKGFTSCSHTRTSLAGRLSSQLLGSCLSISPSTRSAATEFIDSAAGVRLLRQKYSSISSWLLTIFSCSALRRGTESPSRILNFLSTFFFFSLLEARVANCCSMCFSLFLMRPSLSLVSTILSQAEGEMRLRKTAELTLRQKKMSMKAEQSLSRSGSQRLALKYLVRLVRREMRLTNSRSAFLSSLTQMLTNSISWGRCSRAERMVSQFQGTSPRPSGKIDSNSLNVSAWNSSLNRFWMLLNDFRKWKESGNSKSNSDFQTEDSCSTRIVKHASIFRLKYGHTAQLPYFLSRPTGSSADNSCPDDSGSAKQTCPTKASISSRTISSTLSLASRSTTSFNWYSLQIRLTITHLRRRAAEMQNKADRKTVCSSVSGEVAQAFLADGACLTWESLAKKQRRTVKMLLTDLRQSRESESVISLTLPIFITPLMMPSTVATLPFLSSSPAIDQMEERYSSHLALRKSRQRLQKEAWVDSLKMSSRLSSLSRKLCWTGTVTLGVKQRKRRSSSMA